jgi:hypothetical protein
MRDADITDVVPKRLEQRPPRIEDIQPEIHLSAEAINVTRITNPFDPLHSMEREQWAFEGATLADYLPAEVPDHVVALNGRVVTFDEYATTIPQRGDCLVLSPVPQKGGSKGGLLGMVAMLAVAIVAPMAAGAIGSAFGLGTFGTSLLTVGLTLAGSYLVHSLFAPSQPTKNTGDQTDSPTYGIDGAKNTSTEGVPVPVCYGQYRMAGNIIDLYTQNTGSSNQILYMLINAGEGAVAGLDGVMLNGNDAATYPGIGIDGRGGWNDQPPIPWFGNIITPHNVNSKLTTDYTFYTTTGAVDRLRIDVVAPQGLYSVNTKSGAMEPQGVWFDIEYQLVGGDGSWTPLVVPSQLTSWRAVIPTLKDAVSGQPIQTDAAGNVYVWDGFEWAYESPNLASALTAVSSWVYADNLQPVSPADLTYIQANGFSANTPTPQVPVFAVSGGLSIGAATRNAVRTSFDSLILTSGRYVVRVRRTTPESTATNVMDQVYLSDVNEILLDTLTYPNTALLAVTVTLGEHLSSLPQVTYMNHGRIIAVYGAPVPGAAEQWYQAPSSNPAWITWDILTNTRFGGGIDPSRLDFYSFYTWAKYCDAAGLRFNGVIDSEMNVWDATQYPLRIGHAQLVNIGTKWTVVVDKQDTPVMMFSVANMVPDSYKETWLNMSDRANEIDVTFFDWQDNYTQRTIKIYDPVALTAGEPQRTAAITLIGCIDYDTAFREGMIMLNMNRLILKTVEFKAPLEAIGCSVGNLVFVQHDMPNWGQAGRCKAGSTTISVNLDRTVTIAAGKTYKLLVLHSAVTRYAGEVNALTPLNDGLWLVGLNSWSTTPPRVTRLQVTIGGVQRDFAVKDVVPGAGVIADVVGSNIFVGAPFVLYDTDVVDEVVVANPPGDTDVIELAGVLQVAPEQYAQWMFGEASTVKQVYRIKAITSSGEELTRQITAIQYDPNIWDFSRYGDQHLPGTVLDPSQTAIGQVTGLTITEQTIIAGEQVITNAVVYWNAPAVGLYAGADVYWHLNDNPTQVTQVGVQSQLNIQANRGDVVRVSVDAFDVWGKRAPLDGAPGLQYTVLGEIPGVSVGVISAPTVVWSGPDCHLAWRYNSVTHSYDFGSEPDNVGANAGALDPHFKDYQIEVWHYDDDPAAAPRRVEYTTVNGYVYTYGKNAEDGITRRLRFRIRMRDIFNNLGEPALLTAYNPPPTITGMQVTPDWETAVVNIQHSDDADFAGLVVFLTDADGTLIAGDYTALLGTLYEVYRGSGTQVVLNNLMFNSNYWVRVAAYDQFGLTELQPSGAIAFKTTYLNVQAIQDGILDKTKLTTDLQTTIGLAADQTAQIQNLQNEYTVKIGYNSADGRLLASGFGLAITPDAYDPKQGHSAFGVQAETFFVAMPTYPGSPAVTPFVVGFVNGVPTVCMNNAIIGDAAINSARIGDLAVLTEKIQGNAVIIPSYATIGGAFYGNGFEQIVVVNSLDLSLPPNVPDVGLVISAVGEIGYGSGFIPVTVNLRLDYYPPGSQTPSIQGLVLCQQTGNGMININPSGYIRLGPGTVVAYLTFLAASSQASISIASVLVQGVKR